MTMRTYAQAINDTLANCMEVDPSIFIYGIGVPDHKGVFSTTTGLADRFPNRCLDMPLSEAATTGLGIGAAIMGLRPIQVHIRADFALLSMSQLINMAATHEYISGDPVPFVMRVIIGRGWGQGCHHSKSLLSTFAHIPGLNILMPATPTQAAWAINHAVHVDNPTVILEHRWLYWAEEGIPDSLPELDYTDVVLREGTDVTIVATSWMSVEALHAAEILERHHGVSAEVINLLHLRPLYLNNTCTSTEKTGCLLVAEDDWLSCGIGAEVIASLDIPAKCARVGHAQHPCPTARHLENSFYSSAKRIVITVENLLGLDYADLSSEQFYSHENKFKGPF